MTHDEMIEVIQHHKNGGEVECIYKEEDDDTWDLICSPCWDFDTYDYRKKEQPTFTYPMWFREGDYGLVVKFDGLTSGELVENGVSTRHVGYRTNNWWTPHTNPVWKQIEEPKPTMVYPMWFEHVDSKKIVKFIGLTEGIVVRTAEGHEPIGHYANNWVDHTSTQCWKQVKEPNTKTVWFWKVRSVNNDWFTTNYMFSEDEIRLEYDSCLEFKRLDILGSEEVPND